MGELNFGTDFTHKRKEDPGISEVSQFSSMNSGSSIFVFLKLEVMSSDQFTPGHECCLLGDEKTTQLYRDYFISQYIHPYYTPTWRIIPLISQLGHL